MTGSLRIITALVLLGIFSAAQAETVYIAERIRIGLRAEMDEASPVVKTVETGTLLEVVERVDKFARVRDPQGTEGWIEARYLTPDPPARLQLTKLQEDLAKSRTQATEAQTQLKKAQATIGEQADRIKELEKNLSEKPASAPVPAAAATTKKPPVNQTTTDAGFLFSYLWLGISFAMLGIGFAAGIRWLRESIRKRSGGMYLRV
ncbi:MAG: TIGR04211 family SH3 domain-containing protein [Sulfuricaulis sp.]|uniref:TIGR04211 family SH3 domain-containing protein n=1 Tax=Sulfuricaulis sp. TaxID=2003553 RepID=UPI0025F85EE7|nr:TIGR04211 family SH3 domain-containing protein [Sulfuricaulis sp.]MCR4346336.1 TIGR04211 family SH3 domain-containing protein [Sulfuricaulis sp.]